MRAARVAAEEAAALLAALVVVYLAVRLAAGNPLAALGAEGSVSGRAAEALERLLGLRGGLLGGLAWFLGGLARGSLGPSLVYGVDALRLAASRLPYTLAPVAAGAAAGYALYALLYGVAGEAAARLLRPLAYTPGFIIALPAYISAYSVGFPSPLPGVDAAKALVYAAVAAAVTSSRLLHVHRASPSLRLRYAALGASRFTERLREVRAEAAHTLVYLGVLAARLVERSIFIEPILGYTGLGYLALRAVLEGDVPLAAAALSLETMASAAILAALEAVATRLDPRLGGEAQP